MTQEEHLIRHSPCHFIFYQLYKIAQTNSKPPKPKIWTFGVLVAYKPGWTWGNFVDDVLNNVTTKPNRHP